MNQKKDRLLPILGACSAGMMLLLLFSHTYNDILVTAKHGMQFWKILFDGDILHFFELNYVASGNEYYSAVQGCAYNILLYFVFAIWNIPMALLSAFTNVDVMNNIFCIAYIKLMTVAAMAISVVILGRILRLLDVDRKNHGLLAFLYLTSSLMIAVVFVVSQYDLVSVVFQLLGFQAYLEKKDKRFVFFFGIAFCLKYFSVILFLPLLLLRYKRLHSWIMALVGMVLPLAVTSVPFAKSYDRFSTDLTGDLLSKLFRFDGSGYSLFVIFYCFLLVWCFLQKEDAAFSRKAVWASFVAYGLFFSLLDVYLYWAIMFAPFMVLMIATMPRYFYLNLLLETLGYGCVVLGHALTYSNFFFGDTMKSMLMSRILSEDAMNYVGSLIYYLVCQLGMKTWIFPACNSVWIAVIFAMAFLGCPRGSYDGKNSLNLSRECREMLVFRFLVTCGICMLPILSLFI